MAGSWVLFGYLLAYGAMAIYAGHQAYRIRRLRQRLPPGT